MKFPLGMNGYYNVQTGCKMKFARNTSELYNEIAQRRSCTPQIRST